MKRFGAGNKGRLGILITVCMMMQLLLAAGASADTSKPAAAFGTELQNALKGAEKLLYAHRPFPDGAAVGFAKNGSQVPEDYLKVTADKLLDKGGQIAKVTDLTSLALGYAAAGGNMNYIAGIDLYPILMNHPDMEKEGIFALAASYITANNSGYLSAERTSRYPDLIFGHIIELQLEDGSWAANAGQEGDGAATAAALTAISPQYEFKGTPYAEAMDRALQWLRGKQQPDGGFDGKTETTARVVIALSSLGIDAAAFKQESGASALSHLMSRQLAGGGFAQSSGGTSLDMKATEQAYLALTAYKLMQQNKGFLFSGLNNATPGRAMIQIEGPEGTIAQGHIKGGNALEAAVSFLKEKKIAYKLDGGSLTSIGGINNGKFNGQGKWRLAAESRYGSWLFQENAYDGKLPLSDGDRLLIYYSHNTELIDEVIVEWSYKGQIMGGYPPAKVPFVLYIKKANNQLGYLPAAGVTVSVAGKTAVTNAQGKVSLAGLPAGVHRIEMTKYKKGAAPAIAKSSYHLHVSSPELASFSDAAKVAEWARVDMAVALTYGYFQGVSGNVLAPKKALTRAEFTTLLLRLLKEPVDQKAKASFKDVSAGKWYSGAIAKAEELGIVSRSADRFEPNRAITREEAAGMIAAAGRLATFGSESRMAFADTKSLSPASRKAIQAVFEHEVMIGSNGKFNPKQTLVREQAAAILIRLQQLIVTWN